MDPRYNIPLTDPRLGKELLNDDRWGSLAINVWVRYCGQYTADCGESAADYEELPWPEPLLPQQAVDLAEPLAHETIQHLKSGSSEKALATAEEAWRTLFQGSSKWRRGRGKPASMQRTAVRAYIVRKFNPDEPKAHWDKLADKLFLQDGSCPRKIRDKGVTKICGLRQHQYNSFCVKALRTAVDHLIAAMKDDGIPV
jgi:hypothetical protein